MSEEPTRIALGITGASGAPYWRRLVSLLLAADCEVHITHSRNADQVCIAELGIGLDATLEQCQAAAEGRGTLRVFGPQDFYAPMASGTAPYAGMVILPCSTGTMGRVANGVSDSLLTRAADVMLKERRKLVLVVRETPLNLMAVRNMLTLTEAGAVIMPASPGFYYRPETIDDLVDFVVQRVCDQLGVAVRVVRAWGDEERLES